jgi:hypothetical protein
MSNPDVGPAGPGIQSVPPDPNPTKGNGSDAPEHPVHLPATLRPGGTRVNRPAPGSPATPELSELEAAIAGQNGFETAASEPTPDS